MRLFNDVEVITRNLVDLKLGDQLPPSVFDIERRRKIGCTEQRGVSAIDLRNVIAHRVEI